MKLRQALPADAKAIGEVRVAAWQAAYPAFMPAAYLAGLDSSANLEALESRLAAPPDRFSFTVAEVDGALVAFSILGAPRHDSSAAGLELWALNVLPAFWRQGLGRSLIRQAKAAAKELQVDRLELWCIEGNAPAQAAYESCGFVRTGQQRTSSLLTGYALHEALYAIAL